MLHYKVEWYCYMMKSLLDAGKVHANRVLRDRRETIVVQVSNTVSSHILSKLVLTFSRSVSGSNCPVF